ncbi:MAG TPA: pyridoxal 5'-phosphate synthase lyase subunit PdxS, partial [Candidatus Thermoplasmatota archaeon]|nr:pyridoxal 5'-phosphate synthase lyase subunit PdxS [Candidatus Thermoplasmatota archaeon]
KDALRALANTYAQRYTALLGEVRKEAGLAEQPGPKDRLFGDITLEIATDGLFDVLLDVHRLGRLPVVDFAAGGLATPADAALMMQLGNDGVFVGSGIFKSSDPAPRARAIVEAVTHFDDPKVVAEVSRGLGDPMRGQSIELLETRLQDRGE